MSREAPAAFKPGFVALSEVISPGDAFLKENRVAKRMGEP